MAIPAGVPAGRDAGRAGLDRDAARLRHRLRPACWCCGSGEPDLPRPFRTPLVWFVAPMGALSACVSDVLPAVATPGMRLIIWLAIGLVIYFVYGIRKHPKLAGQQGAERVRVFAVEWRSCALVTFSAHDDRHFPLSA